ncbi:chemotaxis protein CheB [Mesorhizobium sp.]|uniref:chemotaxis protein CheB n=1 Tax=Mesorhizobium sp. TaxID=1871066 RepID=UPI0025D6961D|nr:chemotaxis protein CheB [Mesorhizobium sp.]
MEHRANCIVTSERSLNRDGAITATERFLQPNLEARRRMARSKGPTNNHNVIVIGASPGGIEPLKRIVADLAAAVFVVVHVGQVSYLPDILDRAGRLEAQPARNGAAFRMGCIYVAPPGFHLLLHDGHMMLRRGPRENLARPAIDPLFRSAALSYGASVIGVLLSGSLSDGTAGLRAVKAVGGLAVVQHPKDTLVPSMVESALHYGFRRKAGWPTSSRRCPSHSHAGFALRSRG